jgi:hypothetical protein
MEALRLLAHLADYVSLFEASLTIRQVLEAPGFTNLTSEEALACRRKVSQNRAQA